MKFGKLALSFLFLIYEITFSLVTGQAINGEKNDCTKFYNFIRGDDKVYSNDECCSESEITGIYCENGYITSSCFTLNGYPFDKGYCYSNENVDFTSFPYLSKLEKLYLRNRKLKNIPGELFKLSNLEILYIDQNEIETIPPSISNLTKLRELYLFNNKIKILPDEMFKLPNLEIIDLSSNEIEAIPPSISSSTKLKELYIGNNKIKSISDELYKLPNLVELEIDENLSLTNETLTQTNNNLNQKDENSSQEDKKSDSSITNSNTIFWYAVAILIGVFVVFIFINKKKFRKNNESDISINRSHNHNVINGNDESSETKSIAITLNKKSNNDVLMTTGDDTPNIIPSGIEFNDANNSFNTSMNTESTNIISPINPSFKTVSTSNGNTERNNNEVSEVIGGYMSPPLNNFNSNNRNSNITVDSGILNSNAYPGMVLIINNPQNPSYSIMNSGISMTPLSYNKNNITPRNNNEMTHSTKLIGKWDKPFESETMNDEEPPPEYTEN